MQTVQRHVEPSRSYVTAEPPMTVGAQQRSVPSLKFYNSVPSDEATDR